MSSRIRQPGGRSGRWAAFLVAIVTLATASCGEQANTVPADDRAAAEGEAANGGGDRAVPAPEPRLIKHGSRTAHRVALTFDADMTPSKLSELRAGATTSDWYDRRIVAELERTRTPATIFLAGLWAKAHPKASRRLARSPLFELENHSLSHRAFKYPCFGLAPVGSQRRKRAEVVRSSRMIDRVTGVRPRFFRFPGGCAGRSDVRLVAAAGEQPLGWDVNSGDVAQPDPEVIVREVLRQTKPGSIVVMHLVGAPNAPATAQALPEIIRGLRARGYELVTLERLLGEGS